jgi:hypothetical protein
MSWNLWQRNMMIIFIKSLSYQKIDNFLVIKYVIVNVTNVIYKDDKSLFPIILLKKIIYILATCKNYDCLTNETKYIDYLYCLNTW